MTETHESQTPESQTPGSQAVAPAARETAPEHMGGEHMGGEHTGGEHMGGKHPGRDDMGALDPSTATARADRVNYAAPQRSYWDIIVAIFIALLLISNVTAAKLFTGPVVPGFSRWFYQGGPLIFDGGAFLFPLSYVVGDIMTEVYGWRAKRAIWLGFGMNFLAALTYWVVSLTHPVAGFEAWNGVLAPVFRLTIAGLAGYLCGEFLNSYVVIRLKSHFKERRVALRLVTSTFASEFVDTALFCTIAYAGTITGNELANYTITGYVYKCCVELAIVPISLACIRWLKRHEPTYGLAGA